MPSSFLTVHIYIPSSLLSACFILNTQLSSPMVVKALSMFTDAPSWLHSTQGVGTTLVIWHRNWTQRPAITVSFERWEIILGACGGGGGRGEIYS